MREGRFVLREMQGKLGDPGFAEQLRSRELPDDLIRQIRRSARRSPKRKPRPRDQQLRVAAVYAATVKAGLPKPRAQVARTFGLTPQQVGNMLHEARANGYLTRARHGVAGGDLTDAAIALLQDLVRRDQEKAP